MPTNIIADVAFDDVLSRLGADETSVYATKNVTSDGWTSYMAWNPVALYKTESSDVESLKAFIEQQQIEQRLIIGYLSYDLGCLLHEVELQPAPNKLPLAMLASFDNWLEFRDGSLHIHAADDEFLTEVKEILNRQTPALPDKLYSSQLTPVSSRSWYSQAFQKIQGYLKAGDVYQINLTHELTGQTELSGRQLFAKLSATSQSDFQAYIEGEDFEVLSLSPERFIQIKDHTIITQPIKGTRHRGNTADEDERLRQDLLTSPKDQAELNMITDLMRNDLGKICRAGSVQVIETRTLMAYPTLWHAHATVQGKLASETAPIDALLRVLPGGSITGCPKKRAIEIIAELEPKRRGIYTGTVFTLAPDGSLDSNIAIRTLLKQGSELSLSVGGGIVYDSDEASEYQESLDKAASFIL
jgi:para-aminobenzoate synthetase component I